MTPERAKELIIGHYTRVADPNSGPPHSIQRYMTPDEITYLRVVREQQREKWMFVSRRRADYITALLEVAGVESVFDILNNDGS